MMTNLHLWNFIESHLTLSFAHHSFAGLMIVWSWHWMPTQWINWTYPSHVQNIANVPLGFLEASLCMLWHNHFWCHAGLCICLTAPLDAFSCTALANFIPIKFACRVGLPIHLFTFLFCIACKFDKYMSAFSPCLQYADGQFQPLEWLVLCPLPNAGFCNYLNKEF